MTRTQHAVGARRAGGIVSPRCPSGTRSFTESRSQRQRVTIGGASLGAFLRGEEGAEVNALSTCAGRGCYSQAPYARNWTRPSRAGSAGYSRLPDTPD